MRKAYLYILTVALTTYAIAGTDPADPDESSCLQSFSPSNQTMTFNVNLSPPAYSIIELDEWSIIESDDLSAAPILSEGKPSLLSTRYLIAIPVDATVATIQFDAQKTFIPLSKPIMPVPHPTPINERPTLPVPDDDAYTSSTIYPEIDFEYRLVQQASTHLLELTVYPFKYISSSAQLVIQRNIHISITLNTQGDYSEHSLNIVEQNLSSELLNKQDYLLLNNLSRSSNDESPELNGLFSGTPVDYVIITPTAWTSSLSYYVAAKITNGIATRVFNVEEIDATYGMAESCSNIFQFVYEAFTNWNISYVLLAGHTDYVPTKFSRPGYVVPQEYDNYYALLDGPSDTYQDVYVGRCPAQSASELLKITTQWADYDSSSWGRTETSLTGEALESYRAEDFSNLNWNITSLWGEDIGDTITTNDVFETLDQGSMLLNWVGHGSANLWQVAADAGSGLPFYFSDSDAYALTNKAHIPFVNAMCSCYTAVFSKSNCIANSFFRAPEGGAIGYIGANEEVKFASLEIYANKWFINKAKEQFRQSATIRPGIAFHQIIAGRSPALKLFNLLGDPTAIMDAHPIPQNSTPPVIHSATVAAGPYYPGAYVTVNATITDDDCIGVATLTVTNPEGSNSVIGMSYSGITNFYGAVSDPFTSNSGYYAATILAQDVSSNTCLYTNITFEIVADSTPPVISNVSITPQPAATNSTLSITITATDNSGGFPSSWGVITKPDSTVITQQSWELNMFMDTGLTGLYNMAVYARDYSGNVSSPYPTNFLLLADKQGPTIHDYWIATNYYWNANCIVRTAYLTTNGSSLYLYSLISDDLSTPSDLTETIESILPDGSMVTNTAYSEMMESPTRFMGQFSTTTQTGTYQFVYCACDKSGNMTRSDPLLFDITTGSLPPATIEQCESTTNGFQLNCIASPMDSPELWYSTNLLLSGDWNKADPGDYSLLFSNGVYEIHVTPGTITTPCYYRLDLE